MRPGVGFLASATNAKMKPAAVVKREIISRARWVLRCERRSNETEHISVILE